MEVTRSSKKGKPKAGPFKWKLLRLAQKTKVINIKLVGLPQQQIVPGTKRQRSNDIRVPDGKRMKQSNSWIGTRASSSNY